MSDHATHQEVLESTAATEEEMPPQKVPVNVYEASGALVIVAPMAAVMAKDVCVELRPGCVRFWARVRSAGPREYLIKEWDYGGYEREVDLPEGYGAGLEATMANGQIVIRVLRGEPVSELVSIEPKDK